MKQRAIHRGTDHRRKLGLLVAVTALVGFALLQRKVLPTVQLWRACEALADEQRNGTDLQAEHLRLQAAIARLDAQFSPGGPTEDRWQQLLALAAAATSEQGTQLQRIAPAHVEEQEGLHIHTLPVVIEGRADALLNTVDRLERELTHVHIASLDLNVAPAVFGTPRSLTATLYIRSVSP
jgi:hypothetical protein